MVSATFGKSVGVDRVGTSLPMIPFKETDGIIPDPEGNYGLFTSNQKPHAKQSIELFFYKIFFIL